MMTEKITELDKLLLPASQMAKIEASRIMKKTKNDNEGWITIGKKNVKINFQSGLTGHVSHYNKCITENPFFHS